MLRESNIFTPIILSTGGSVFQHVPGRGYSSQHALGHRGCIKACIWAGGVHPSMHNGREVYGQRGVDRDRSPMYNIVRFN